MRILGPGALVAGYRIERRLGTGGSGSVYLARHPRLPRHDALKVLSRAADDEFRMRFLREAELAGRLDHPNIVSIYDCGDDGELLWIAMQFVDGYDAAQLLRQQPGGLPAERAVTIVTDAARGLDQAHRAGLLHRDVKPANLLIEPGGAGPDRVLVADFGIARATTESAALTAAGKVLATLAYAAPEQIGGGHLDQRTDVYALGGTLYQLLTGAAPFPRETAAAVMHAHLAAPRPRPSAAVARLPRGFDTVIARAMAVNPEERYRSCGELAEAASAALRGELAGPRAEPRSGLRTLALPRPTPAPRRRRIAVLIVTVATVAALIAGFLLTRPDGSPRNTADDPVTTTNTPESPWGAYGFIVETFPELLPATPSGRGHHNYRCSASDNSNNAVAMDTALEQPVLVCAADDEAIWVTCNTDRSPMPALEHSNTTEGGETWSRATGTGQLSWMTFDSHSGKRGRLDIRFDGAREFCKLRVTGADSGRALFDQWWPTAPV
ncbi:serine/threonine-protein kinase [Nocardia crassostreae]|uniref:serine/threonine-protein kinase n=1 Tax=Nocardia crassostreae TaxID=53428 RepID=UPI000829C0C6|nr:serine/threonine-protein kinase [Nocardia crassostreae]